MCFSIHAYVFKAFSLIPEWYINRRHRYLYARNIKREKNGVKKIHFLNAITGYNKLFVMRTLLADTVSGMQIIRLLKPVKNHNAFNYFCMN